MRRRRVDIARASRPPQDRHATAHRRDWCTCEAAAQTASVHLRLDGSPQLIKTTIKVDSLH